MRLFQGILSGHVEDILEIQEYLPAQQGHAGLGFGVSRDLGWQGLQASRDSGWAGTQILRDLGMQASGGPSILRHPEFGMAAGIGGTQEFRTAATPKGS